VASRIEEVLQREAGRVLATLIRLLGDFDLAEEARQDAFAAAIEQWPATGVPANPAAWLVQVGRNKTIDAQRRQKRNPLDFRETMDGVLEAQQETARDPFADVHDRELRENLIRAINELTPEHKAVIVLRTIEGLSYKDIGEILGCSEGTVMSRLHYARKKLQDKLSAFL